MNNGRGHTETGREGGGTVGKGAATPGGQEGGGRRGGAEGPIEVMAVGQGGGGQWNFMRWAALFWTRLQTGKCRWAASSTKSRLHVGHGNLRASGGGRRAAARAPPSGGIPPSEVSHTPSPPPPTTGGGSEDHLPSGVLVERSSSMPASAKGFTRCWSSGPGPPWNASPYSLNGPAGSRGGEGWQEGGGGLGVGGPLPPAASPSSGSAHRGNSHPPPSAISNCPALRIGTGA